MRRATQSLPYRVPTGWVREGTGGGCEAFVCAVPNAEVWVITRDEDPSIPTRADELVTLGYYASIDVWDGNETGPTMHWTFATVAEAFRAVWEVRVGLAKLEHLRSTV